MGLTPSPVHPISQNPRAVLELRRLLRSDQQGYFIGAAEDRQRRLDADAVSGQQFVECVNGRDRLAVEVHHHVSFAQAGAVRRTAGRNRYHQHPV